MDRLERLLDDRQRRSKAVLGAVSDTSLLKASVNSLSEHTAGALAYAIISSSKEEDASVTAATGAILEQARTQHLLAREDRLEELQQALLGLQMQLHGLQGDAAESAHRHGQVRGHGGNACVAAVGNSAADKLSRNAAAASLAKRVGAISALPLVVAMQPPHTADVVPEVEEISGVGVDDPFALEDGAGEGRAVEQLHIRAAELGVGGGPSEVAGGMESTELSRLLKELRLAQGERAEGRREGGLEEVAAALKAGLPRQEQQLQQLRLQQEVLRARLGAGQGHGREEVRGDTAAGRAASRGLATRGMTSTGRVGVAKLCRSIVEDLVLEAERRVGLRPGLRDVVVEMGAWGAAGGQAAGAIARQLLAGLVWEVVDDLIGEIAGGEVDGGSAAGQQLAFQLLVEGVAGSQRGYTYEVGAVKRLLQSAPSSPQGRAGSSAGRGEGVAGLYVQALGGLLHEMRGRQGRGSPGGHTQQLSPIVHPGSAPEHVQRVERMEVPLAAAPSILRQLDSPPALIDPGPWPRLQHATAAATEREYWAGVGLQPAFPTPLATVSKQHREQQHQQQEAAAGHPASPGRDLAAAAAAGSAEALHARPGSHVRGGTDGPATQHRELGLVQVPQGAGHITCMRSSPGGEFLAVGTQRGKVLVVDLRSHPARIAYQAEAEGGPLQSGKGGQQGRPEAAVAALCWSEDSIQLAALDTSSRLRWWWHAPAPEAAQGHRQGPLPLNLAITVLPSHMAGSGKDAVGATLAAGLVDDTQGHRHPPAGAEVDMPVAGMSLLVARQGSAAFLPGRALLGNQSSIVIPQVTGDVLSLTVTGVGPSLPILPPPTLASAPFERQLALHPASLEFLLPAATPHPHVNQQVVHRAHTAEVVLCGFLEGSSTMLTVDTSGLVAFWHAAGTPCGFGWVLPSGRWQLRQVMATLQPRGVMRQVWPQQASSAAGARQSASKKINGAQQLPVDDSALVPLSAEEEGALKHNDPQGDVLLATRTLWLVQHRRDSTGRAISTETWRSLDPALPAALVFSEKDAAGRLISRRVCGCALTPAPMRVSAAMLTPSGRDLLMAAALVLPSDGEAAPWRLVSIHVVNLERMKIGVPRIDLPDPSNGCLPPAWAVTSTLASVGSEYLLADLGAGVLGVHSLATGQLVQQISLEGYPPAGPPVLILQHIKVGRQQSLAPNSGSVLLAAAPEGSTAVLLYWEDCSMAAAAVQRRLAAAFPRPQGPPPGARKHSEWDAIDEADDGADECGGDQNAAAEGTGVVQDSGSAQKEVKRQKKAIIRQLVDAVKEQLAKHLVGRVLHEPE